MPIRENPSILLKVIKYLIKVLSTVSLFSDERRLGATRADDTAHS